MRVRDIEGQMMEQENTSETAVDFERFKMNLEHSRALMERSRLYLELVKTGVEPIRAAGEKSRDMAFGFAQMALRSAFLLNGGALVVMPAFSEILSHGILQNLWFMLASMASFAIGLVLATTATLFAFHAMDNDSRSLQHRAAEAQTYYRRLFEEADPTRIEASEPTQQGTHDQAFQRWRLRAIATGVLAIILFIVGTFLAAFVFEGSSPPAAEDKPSSRIRA